MSDDLIANRSRADYVTASSDMIYIPVEAPLECGLELPVSYAKELLLALQENLKGLPRHESGTLRLDVPFRLRLRRQQVEQLVESLQGACG